MSSSFWEDRYSTDEYVYGREPNDFLREEAHRIRKGRVLCLAEGEGRNAVFLAGLGHDVIAVDSSAAGLRKAERLARERNVPLTTVHADLTNYEPEWDTFTGVVAIFAHLPVAIRQKVHGWIPRALRVGGVFILEAYSPAQLAFDTGGPRDLPLLMTLHSLSEELHPLAVDVGREVEREIHEGIFHGGRSATVQLVARRT